MDKEERLTPGTGLRESEDLIATSAGTTFGLSQSRADRTGRLLEGTQPSSSFTSSSEMPHLAVGASDVESGLQPNTLALRSRR
jgi:hypothetical protein